MTRNVVLCLDGTNNKIKQAASNVLELYGLLDKDHPDRQVAYYQPGVGTFSSPGTWTPVGRNLTRTLGSAFGFGFRQNLGDAYHYLMSVYEPGDRIYVFGFSRGAYTARAVVGMLDMFGVFRRGAENLVPHAVNHYVRRVDDKTVDWKTARDYASLLSHTVGKSKSHVPVHFLGLWDTVNAIGTLRRKITLPYTAGLPHVQTIRHALSIDERRRSFRPYWVGPPPESHRIPPPRGEVQEVWFPGVHSDVGGSFVDGSPLWLIPLLWMVNEAKQHQLVVVDRRMTPIRSRVSAELAVAPPHTMGGLWRLMVYRQRSLPPGAHIHGSVRDRVQRDADYAERLPEGHQFVDDDWLTYMAPKPRKAAGSTNLT